MMNYSMAIPDAAERKKKGLERDRLIDVLQALVTVALWLRLDWLLLSAWSGARALIAVWLKAALSAALCWLVILW